MIKEGIINVNKPAGMSSHDVVYVFRKLMGVRRIGHTGTLDPQAQGVLPVCIGTATRIPEYLDQDFKTYRCSMLLGVTSDSQDIWGKEIDDHREAVKETIHSGGGCFQGAEGEGQFPLTPCGIEAAFATFNGVVTQVPPMYSAVWVNGRRLYDYARSGQTVEIPTRTIYIDNLTVEDIDLEELKVTFKVTCTKGTYIRTICSDVGEKLGCGAAMCELTRVASGAFDIEKTVDWEYLVSLKDRRLAALEKLPKTQKMPRGRMNDAEILTGGIDVLAKLYGVEGEIDPALRAEWETIDDEVNALMMGIDESLVNFGRAVIHTDELVDWFLNGGHIRMSEVDVLDKPRFENGDFPLEMRDEFTRAYRLYAPEDGSFGGAFLGVAFYDLGYKKLVADKVFYRK